MDGVIGERRAAWKYFRAARMLSGASPARCGESRSGNFPTLARAALESAIRNDVDLIELLLEPKPSLSKRMALASW